MRQHYCDISKFLLIIGFTSITSVYINFADLFNDEIHAVKSNTQIGKPCHLRIERQICKGITVGLGNKTMQLLDSDYIPYNVTEQTLCLDKSVSMYGKSECFGLNRFVETLENNKSRSIGYKFVNYNDPQHMIHLKFEDYIVAIIFKISEYNSLTGVFRTIQHGKFTQPFPSITTGADELDKIADYMKMKMFENITDY